MNYVQNGILFMLECVSARSSVAEEITVLCFRFKSTASTVSMSHYHLYYPSDSVSSVKNYSKIALGKI